MVEFSAGGEKEAEEELEAVAKGCGSWKHTVRALVGSSSGILGETLPFRNGIPKLVREASNAPRPIKVYIDLQLCLVWCLCFAETTRISNWRQWPILVGAGTIIGLIVAILLGE